MFDLDPESLWMGPEEPRKKRKSKRFVQERSLFGDMGASNYNYDYDAPRPRYYKQKPRYSKKQYYKLKKQKNDEEYSLGDYVKGAYKGAKTTYKGAKTTYKGIKGFLEKQGKPKSLQDRTISQKLFKRGSIYGKDKFGRKK